MAILKSMGKNPAGVELQKVGLSPNYKDGSFKNISPTEMIAPDSSFISTFWKFINKPRGTKPPAPLPHVKTDLKKIKSDTPVIVWFGHSSYLIHVNGINILVDPVFCGHASPFTFTAKSFPGANAYGVEDMPPVDILILTHDHYDHLDYETVVKLNSSTKMICTSLGVASHLVYWGYDKNKITEFDWWDAKQVMPGFEITATPGRHFSGRSFVRNKTLWSSFVLTVPGYKIFIGGDSGYDTHFKTIGEKFGSFDIAMLECGQYNTAWPHIHMMPEQTAQASIDLGAKILLPVHWAKFDLSLHPWSEPITRVSAAAKQLGITLTTPVNGEKVVLGQALPNTQWWLSVK